MILVHQIPDLINDFNPLAHLLNPRNKEDVKITKDRMLQIKIEILILVLYKGLNKDKEEGILTQNLKIEKEDPRGPIQIVKTPKEEDQGVD